MDRWMRTQKQYAPQLVQSWGHKNDLPASGNHWSLANQRWTNTQTSLCCLPVSKPLILGYPQSDQQILSLCCLPIRKSLILGYPQWPKNTQSLLSACHQTIDPWLCTEWPTNTQSLLSLSGNHWSLAIHRVTNKYSVFAVCLSGNHWSLAIHRVINKYSVFAVCLSVNHWSLAIHRVTNKYSVFAVCLSGNHWSLAIHSDQQILSLCFLPVKKPLILGYPQSDQQILSLLSACQETIDPWLSTEWPTNTQSGVCLSGNHWSLAIHRVTNKYSVFAVCLSGNHWSLAIHWVTNKYSVFAFCLSGKFGSLAICRVARKTWSHRLTRVFTHMFLGPFSNDIFKYFFTFHRK